jgi:hypothetical protein
LKRRDSSRSTRADPMPEIRPPHFSQSSVCPSHAGQRAPTDDTITIQSCAASALAARDGRPASDARRSASCAFRVGAQFPDICRQHQNQLFPARTYGEHVEVRIDDLGGDIARMNRRALSGESLDALARAVAQEATLASICPFNEWCPLLGRAMFAVLGAILNSPDPAQQRDRHSCCDRDLPVPA